MSAAVVTPSARAPSERLVGSPPAREPMRGVALATSRTITTILVVGPVVALGIALPLLWGHAIGVRDVLLALAFYLVSAFGVTFQRTSTRS